MADKRAIDADEIVEELESRAALERARGGYPDADELAGIELDVAPERGPDSFGDGFDLGGTASRIRLRPELGFSSKRVVGPLISGVKKVNLRLLAHVLDDLARQTDAAVLRLETALAAEMSEREAAIGELVSALRAERVGREALANELHVLSERIAALEEQAKRPS